MSAILAWIGRFIPRGLQLRLSLLVSALLFLLAILIGAVSSDSIRGIMLHQIENKTLVVAEAVALNPIVVEGIEKRDPTRIQELAEQVRRVSFAEYVVVADRQGIRYSHPVPERIGQEFVGGDYQAAIIEGRSYVSRAVGTLGPSMRGFVPVRNTGGEIIGFVAVGHLQYEIEAQVYAQQRRVIGYSAVVLLFGVIGAGYIGRSFKAAIFGLEPHEIAALFEERNAIIESIREGIVAVDGAGRLTLVNQAARRYLDMAPDTELRGCRLSELSACREMELALAEKRRAHDHEILIAERAMIVNILPLGPVSGAVASFRPKDEIDRLARKLLHMQEYSDLLRAQTHEYSNKLHTVAGLIQIGAHQEALELVMNEASGYQELLKTLAEAVPDPIVAGLILGKFNRARELKINLNLDPDSSFADIPPHISRSGLVTILGNLLDNAFEAARLSEEGADVRLFLTDLGLDLIIEVEDSGRGVPANIADTLFERGVTTNEGPGRGVGLFLVNRAVEAAGGYISFGKGELGGALFTVSIPKKSRPENSV